ncbi:MAG: hypothetical protein Q8K34_17980, partial [Hydrogenophaga sp.]|nr:hypothetical protein [Hydrogenophaga sp.]
MTQPSRFRLIQRPGQTARAMAMGLVSCIAFSAYAQVHDLGTVGAAPELIGNAPVNPPMVATAPAAASAKSAPLVGDLDLGQNMGEGASGKAPATAVPGVARKAAQEAEQGRSASP